MKKIVLSILTAFAALTMYAENTINITPVKVATGTQEVYVYIEMNNDVPVYTIQFDVVLPDGIKPYLNAKGNPNSSTLALSNDDNRVEYYDEDEDDDVTVFANSAGSSYIDYNGRKVLRYNGAGTYPVAGTSGKIFKLRLKLDANLAEGVYPVVLNRGMFLDPDNNGAENIVSTSYIIVGNPTDQSLTMEGEIPSFVNEKLATETAITSLNLSAVTKVNGIFTYVDGRAVTAPADQNVKADKAVYSRTVGAGNYASLKAPFAATGCSNLYTLDNNSDNLGSEWVNFTEAATIAAGDNLLVKGDIALSAENVALGHVDAAHKENDVYYVKNDLFYRGTNITINPLRTCWKLQGGNSNLMIAIDGEPTGITLNTIDGLNTPTYDLQGRRSENAQHGIFVTNGKKQIIK